MKTKYRIIAAIMIASLLGCLAGCGKTEEQAEPDQNSETENGSAQTETDEHITLNLPENMLAYYLVLTGKKPFVGAFEGGQKFYWNEYFWVRSEPELFTPHNFMIVDLDRDGEDEFVFTGLPETTQIFDYQDGTVYHYQFPYRGMSRILESGVYDGSSAADIGGLYRITLDKGTWEEETLAYMEHDYFEVEGTEVSSGEFYDYIAPYNDAEPVQSMDFTEELLEKALLGDLSEEELSVVRNAPIEKIDEEAPDLSKVPQECIEVLTEGKEFICVTEEQEKYYLEGNSLKSKSGDEQYQVFYFSIVDMDGDDIPEIVLTCEYSTLILHRTEGEVHGYLSDYWDGVGAIAKDGSFTQTSSRHHGQHGKILSFGSDDCEIEWFDDVGNEVLDRVWYYSFTDDKKEKYFP